MSSRSVLLSAGILLSAACASSKPEPHSTAIAAAQRAECSSEASGQASRELTAVAVERVEPLYSVVHTNEGEESRLIGAKLELRPLDGVTADSLARTLECHAAQHVLLAKSDDPNCPYWVPDGWADIDVKSNGGGFLVTLTGHDLAESKRILSRAVAFAEADPR